MGVQSLDIVLGSVTESVLCCFGECIRRSGTIRKVQLGVQTWETEGRWLKGLLHLPGGVEYCIPLCPEYLLEDAAIEVFTDVMTALVENQVVVDNTHNHSLVLKVPSLAAARS